MKNHIPSNDLRLRSRLSPLLKWGARLSIALLFLSYFLNNTQFANMGIEVLILIPFLRVLYMGLFYFFNKERNFALIAFTVFAIMSLSFLVGLLR